MGGKDVAEQKTNVMRLLDQKKIPYRAHEYPHGDGAVDGLTVAKITGQDPARVFKTLVARGASGRVCVFVLPVAEELDLKKAARAAGEKSVAMVRPGELPGLTGYVRGGCSPIGMKKRYPTFFDSGMEGLETVLVSAGRIGSQAELAPAALLAVTGGSLAELTVKEA